MPNDSEIATVHRLDMLAVDARNRTTPQQRSAELDRSGHAFPGTGVSFRYAADEDRADGGDAISFSFGSDLVVNVLRRHGIGVGAGGYVDDEFARTNLRLSSQPRFPEMSFSHATTCQPNRLSEVALRGSR